MEILRRGTKHTRIKNWYVVECAECGTIIMLSEDDPTLIDNICGYVSYECPICHEIVGVQFYVNDIIICPEDEKPDPDLSMLYIKKATKCKK